MVTWMAHRPAITEIEDSDEEGIINRPVAQQVGNSQGSRNYQRIPLFAPPEGHNEEESDDSTLSEEEMNDEYQQPQGTSAGPSRGYTLAHILNDVAASSSISAQTRTRQSNAVSGLSSNHDPQRDEELRAVLGLGSYKPVDPFNVEMADDTLDEASAHSQSSPNALAANERPKISEYQCPICFSPPSHACLTQCGHVMCANCLFSSVRAARERHVRLYGRGAGPDGEGKVSRCPVCRAIMKGWDGKGAGVIGLKLEMKGKEANSDIVMPF